LAIIQADGGCALLVQCQWRHGCCQNWLHYSYFGYSSG